MEPFHGSSTALIAPLDGPTAIPITAEARTAEFTALAHIHLASNLERPWHHSYIAAVEPLEEFRNACGRDPWNKEVDDGPS